MLVQSYCTNMKTIPHQNNERDRKKKILPPPDGPKYSKNIQEISEM